MNLGKRTFTMVALTLAVSLALSARAQGDDLLQRYDLAMENLSIAVESVPDDSAQATDELDQAVNALLSLSRGSTSPSLVTSMEHLFERARTAVQNRSHADVAVQAAVLAGGFRRIVFESAFREAVAGDLDTARARLDRIAADMGMPQAVRDTLTAAPDPNTLRLRFEAGVAQGIQRRLAAARTGVENDREGAYQDLAQAYGDSLMLQDSPRLETPMNDGFVAAADALVALDEAGFAAATQALEAAAQAVVVASAAALAGDADVSTPAVAGGATPSELPTLAPSEAPGAASGVASAPEAGETSTTDTPSASTAEASTVAAPSAPTSPDARQPGGAAAPPLDLDALRAQFEDERQDAQRRALNAQVVAAGLTGADADGLVDGLLAAGITDLDDAVQQLYADVGRATALVIAGDITSARAQIARTAADYQSTLAPLIARKSADTDAAMRNALTRGVHGVGLRMQDVDALTGQVDAVARAVVGQAAPANQVLNAQTLSLWAGWPRLVVMLVFGILAFVPLYLLNLAFGGGNRNWQLIGVALFLLLLPVVYEALASIGSLVAYLTGDDAFEVLATYSMFQSPVGQVVWAVLIVLAILFAISGLYGICVQFGLLGRRRGNRAPGPSATQTNTATMTSTGGQDAADALVDWDEEF